MKIQYIHNLIVHPIIAYDFDARSESDSSLNIRPEISDDIQAIESVIIAAYTGVFTDSPNEHLIINGLREARAFSLSLVTEANRKIIGHIAFSVVLINRIDVGWLGLGPISYN